MQNFSDDKAVRNDTVHDLKKFIAQPLATRTKIEEQLVSIMRAFNKTFDLMGDDMTEL